MDAFYLHTTHSFIIIAHAT